MDTLLNNGRMSNWRTWVLTDAPQSRRQAAIGMAYRSWLQFSRNWLAMTGLIALLALFALAIFAPELATHDPNAQDLAQRLAPPSAVHWFGTDQLGRDLFSRLLFGARITLGMAVLIVAIVAPVGLLVGSVAGYAGGWTDRILMRITDVFLAFPKLVLALAFVSALKPGLTSVVLAIALTAWPPYARLARAETLVIRNADFVSAIRLTGASATRIVLHHIMPLCIASVIVRVALDVSGIVLTAAGLGFLGMGAQAPSPEWGAMIASTRGFILQQWWVPAIPGIAIFVASFAFNLLGDGLRDVFDPKSE
ncbi:ABC transporter permease [Caballeronia sp. LjRoot34]|uniref:ABC transporter permease n=1 Tax=Caballeronia sp. LjRoot34 TaxID=3342325 RepID=UPI003ECC83B6